MRDFETFAREVNESVSLHAKRKGYVHDGDDGLMAFKRYLGVSTGHHIGEIANKLAEYMAERRRVILVKIAGHCFLEWQNCDRE